MQRPKSKLVWNFELLNSNCYFNCLIFLQLEIIKDKERNELFTFLKQKLFFYFVNIKSPETATLKPNWHAQNLSIQVTNTYFEMREFLSLNKNNYWKCTLNFKMYYNLTPITVRIRVVALAWSTRIQIDETQRLLMGLISSTIHRHHVLSVKGLQLKMLSLLLRQA